MNSGNREKIRTKSFTSKHVKDTKFGLREILKQFEEKDEETSSDNLIETTSDIFNEHFVIEKENGGRTENEFNKEQENEDFNNDGNDVKSGIKFKPPSGRDKKPLRVNNKCEKDKIAWDLFTKELNNKLKERIQKIKNSSNENISKDYVKETKKELTLNSTEGLVSSKTDNKRTPSSVPPPPLLPQHLLRKLDSNLKIHSNAKSRINIQKPTDYSSDDDTQINSLRKTNSLKDINKAFSHEHKAQSKESEKYSSSHIVIPPSMRGHDEVTKPEVTDDDLKGIKLVLDSKHDFPRDTASQLLGIPAPGFRRSTPQSYNVREGQCPYITLNANHLKGVTTVKVKYHPRNLQYFDISKLRILNISSNNLQILPDPFKTTNQNNAPIFPPLQELYAADNQLTDLAPISRYQRLRILHVPFNNISVFPERYGVQPVVSSGQESVYEMQIVPLNNSERSINVVETSCKPNSLPLGDLSDTGSKHLQHYPYKNTQTNSREAPHQEGKKMPWNIGFSECIGQDKQRNLVVKGETTPAGFFSRRILEWMKTKIIDSTARSSVRGSDFEVKNCVLRVCYYGKCQGHCFKYRRSTRGNFCTISQHIFYTPERRTVDEYMDRYPPSGQSDNEDSASEFCLKKTSCDIKYKSNLTTDEDNHSSTSICSTLINNENRNEGNELNLSQVSFDLISPPVGFGDEDTVSVGSDSGFSGNSGEKVSHLSVDIISRNANSTQTLEKQHGQWDQMVTSDIHRCPSDLSSRSCSIKSSCFSSVPNLALGNIGDDREVTERNAKLSEKNLEDSSTLRHFDRNPLRKSRFGRGAVKLLQGKFNFGIRSKLRVNSSNNFKRYGSLQNLKYYQNKNLSSQILKFDKNSWSRSSQYMKGEMKEKSDYDSGEFESRMQHYWNSGVTCF
ncbi:hypothetical protein Anas_07131 [Armadillidium nasatum]|uniref:Uncharacterized protein n=1 Tax=Armadillidium nasatum TaxID=96803 RepID=A0A5N5SV24_9CRUS|nr:hypothetical protein Anas_07131 [Armadillidium nasatum]